jgi:hypothetical protein
MKKTDSFHETDAEMHLWLENEPSEQRLIEGRNELIWHLRDRGFVLDLCPRTARDFPAIAKDHHRGVRGDLHVLVNLRGRTLEIKFFQELVTENRHGGEFDFQQRQKMPYLVGKLYELERNHIAILMLRLGFPKLRRDITRTGMAYIQHRRDELEAFQGRGFYDPARQHAFNRRSASGTLLSDGDRVVFRCEYTGRQWIGVAYANINSMWWVLLPGGEVRNLPCDRLLIAAGDATNDAKRGREFAPTRIERRLGDALKWAVREQRFERAAVVRDVINLKFGRAERMAA